MIVSLATTGRGPRLLVVSALILLLLLPLLLPHQQMAEFPTTTGPLPTVEPRTVLLERVLSGLDALCEPGGLPESADELFEQLADAQSVVAASSAAGPSGAEAAQAVDRFLGDLVEAIAVELEVAAPAELTELMAVLCKVVATFRSIATSRTSSA
jgi:hypothetical protein